MPIYEFRCSGCRKKVSIFTRSIADPLSPECPHCSSTELVRLVSGFAYHSTANVWTDDKGPPPAMGGPDYYKDPRNIGLWTEHRLKQLGMDMRSEEYRKTFSEAREMIDAAREGEMPDAIKDV